MMVHGGWLRSPMHNKKNITFHGTAVARLQGWLLTCPMQIRWRVCAAYLGVIAVLSLLPAAIFPQSATSLPGADKWVHVMMYGGLASLLQWLVSGKRLGPRLGWLVVVGAFGYGLLMEILQALYTHGQRGFGWDDLAANMVGAIIFWFIAMLISRPLGAPR